MSDKAEVRSPALFEFYIGKGVDSSLDLVEGDFQRYMVHPLNR